MSINTGDTAWLLMSSALVMLMTPGLALFYGGMVRRKNVLSTMMMSFACLGLVGLLWVLYGYSLAFGTDHGGIIGGLNFLGLRNVGQDAFDGLCHHRPPPGFHDIPGDVRHHHGGSVYRGHRGKDEVQRPARLFRSMVDHRLLPGGALGLGQRRLAGQARCA